MKLPLVFFWKFYLDRNCICTSFLHRSQVRVQLAPAQLRLRLRWRKNLRIFRRVSVGWKQQSWHRLHIQPNYVKKWKVRWKYYCIKLDCPELGLVSHLFKVWNIFININVEALFCMSKDSNLKWNVHINTSPRGFLKNRHACFELSHSIESSLRSLSTL